MMYTKKYWVLIITNCFDILNKKYQELFYIGLLQEVVLVFSLVLIMASYFSLRLRVLRRSYGERLILGPWKRKKQERLLSLSC